MRDRNGAILVAYVSLAVAAFLVGRAWPTSEAIDPGSRPGEAIAAHATAQAGPADSSPRSPGPSPGPAAPVPQGTVAAGAGSGAARPPADPNQVWRIRLEPDDPSKGPADAPATIVVFSTFLCPECAQMAGHVDRIVTEHGQKVRVVFKHKLFSSHLHAMEAAEAAAEANAQGKFWPFHDRAQAKGVALDRGSIEEIAREVGMDVGRLRAALADGRHRGRVLRDSLLATETAAHSMPNVAVNGVRLFGDKTYENLKALVGRKLADAQAAIAAGTAPARLYASLVEGGKAFDALDPRRLEFSADEAMVRGPKDARVHLVVFEDFQCPFCAKVNPSIEAFRKRFPDDVRVVFKHFPLTDIHADAQAAAEAAVEAARQGKFWPFHDLLFRNQKDLNRAGLERLAEQAGLDVAALRKALDGRAHQAAVTRDVAEGGRAGVTGTPVIFLNGRRYQGPQGNPPEGIEAAARAYLGLGSK
jgi:protein-disulfide isomerase